MKKSARPVVAVAIAASCAALLSGCSPSFPNLAGVWTASDGSSDKTISDVGNCTNMLYRDSKIVTSRTPGMCHIIGRSGDTYTLQVVQKPYSQKYTARFSDDGTTIALSAGATTFVTLKRVPGSH
ncbi:hypothetical protein AS850_05990 [Frondihabitans sp. 762G35]|nr:hypothetical protein AS850_05990 [Frondihabitans sp. 762G35]